jgi:hypothetical protein
MGTRGPNGTASPPIDQTGLKIFVPCIIAYLIMTTFMILYVAFGNYDQQRIAAIFLFFEPLKDMVVGIMGYYLGKGAKR